MTATEAIERQSKHENLISELTTLLMRANAGLWVAETSGMKCDFKDLRAEIRDAIDKADRETMQ